MGTRESSLIARLHVENSQLKDTFQIIMNKFIIAGLILISHISLSNANSWLIDQQGNNGQFSSDMSVAVPSQGTAEALVGLIQTDALAGVDLVAALQYLTDNNRGDSEAIARQIWVRSFSENPDTALLESLVILQNADGGWAVTWGRSVILWIPHWPFVHCNRLIMAISAYYHRQ